MSMVSTSRSSSVGDWGKIHDEGYGSDPVRDGVEVDVGGLSVTSGQFQELLPIAFT